jgi:dienelactone hydrolase
VGHWGLSKEEPVVQARAASFARLGLAALVYDALGQGERAVPGNEHSNAAIAALLGESNMTYMVWDSVRALDLLEGRGEIDGSRLGVTGCSGGGLNTLYLMAVDGRLDAAVPVGYVCAFASFLGTGILHCPCSHVPGMARLSDMGEIAALFAPKPLLVVGGRKDPMFTEAGMRAAFGEIERNYALQGAEPPALFFDDCGHDYSRPMRERAYGFFLKALRGQGTGDPVPEPLEEGAWKPEPPGELSFWVNGRVPPRSATYRACVEAGLAAHRGLPRAKVLEGLGGLVPRPDPALWPWSAVPHSAPAGILTDGLRGEIVQGDEGLSHRALAVARHGASGGVASALTAVVLEDAGLTPFTEGFLREILALGLGEARAVEPPLWSETGERAHLAWTNGLLVGRPLAALWARALLAEVGRAPGDVVMVARGPAASSTALVVALLAGAKVRALATVGAPATWLDLVAGSVGRQGAILPRAGLLGDVADLLGAASIPVLWSGCEIGGISSCNVEARSSCARPSEIRAWLARCLGG